MDRMGSVGTMLKELCKGRQPDWSEEEKAGVYPPKEWWSSMRGAGSRRRPLPLQEWQYDQLPYQPQVLTMEQLGKLLCNMWRREKISIQKLHTRTTRRIALSHFLG